MYHVMRAKVRGMAQDESSSETAESQTNERANANFVQLSRHYLRDMRRLARKSAVAHEILYYLVEHMGRTTNAVVVSYQTLVEVTGTSRATVARAVKLLKDQQWIDSVKIGSASAYAVNERIFWQAGRNQRQYAVFSATVIATETEQESGFREKAKQSLKHIPVVESHDITTTGKETLPPPDQGDLEL